MCRNLQEAGIDSFLDVERSPWFWLHLQHWRDIFWNMVIKSLPEAFSSAYVGDRCRYFCPPEKRAGSWTGRPSHPRRESDSPILAHPTFLLYGEKMPCRPLEEEGPAGSKVALWG